MNTPSNAVPEFPLDPQGITPAPISATRRMVWSVRRELWENRSIYVAPLIVAAVVLFGSSFSVIGLPGNVRNLPTGDAAKRAAISRHFRMAPAPIMLATLLVGIFYSLDALYGERRDRSILFWKSLPVSDLTTVLSKASIPLVVLPVIAFVLSVVTLVILMLLGTAVLLGSGVSPGPLWAGVRIFQEPVVMIYGLTIHALWFAPIYAWLLLISGWARRTPVLWVALPLLAIAALEKMAFNTTRFVKFLGYRVTGAMGAAFEPVADGDISRLTELTPGRFLSTPGLWVGLVFTAACLAATVRLRRNREPI